jgi:endopolyphosphatase
VDGCAARTEPGYEHMEWLRIQLQFLRARGMKAIMSGHVPPARNDEKVGWDETCWQKYTLWMQQYRDVVVGAVYGHMNIEHFVLQDFKDIDLDRAAGNKPGLTAGFRGSSKSEETQVGVLMNDGSYLQSLRRIWSKLPAIPAALIGQGVESSNGRVTPEERDYYDKIGGKYAERFAVSHMAASVVPNYFPALRVFEYNITGLEDHVVFAEDASSVGSSERWHDEEVIVPNGEYVADEEEDDSRLLTLPRLMSIFRQTQPTATRKKKHRLIIPDPPSKHAPPGPAYSPQVLSWLGYTQYFANLTHINNDFGPGTRPEPDQNPNIMDSTSPNPAYDPLRHYPTTPQNLLHSALELEVDGHVDALRWNPGKHSDHSPKHARPNPLNFTFQIEYDTRRVNDSYAIANGSTVRAWLELATRMGEFRPRRAKDDGLRMDGEDADEVDDEWVDRDTDDEEMDAQNKKKKHPHHDDGKDDEARERRRRRKAAEKTWFAFASRAVVGTMTREEIAERFGYE